MTNASCADCGRIVAFRTHDPSEIAECRSCGIWVKRSSEMPGVAVSVKKATSAPAEVKTTLPQSIQVKESTLNIRRSAAKRTALQKDANESAPQEKKKKTISPRGAQEDALTPKKVYSAIRALEKSILTLKTGQKSILANQDRILAGQEQLVEGQGRLETGQKKLQKGQKHLHTGYQQLKEGQKILLERTLPVPDMPIPGQAKLAAHAGQNDLERNYEEPPNGFFTTPFSALNIPVIPLKLEDLAMNPVPAEEDIAIPATERSDLTGLLEGPLPEPPPREEPKPQDETSPQGEPEPASPTSDPFDDLDTAEEPFKENEEDSSPFQQEEEIAASSDPFHEPSHESPFSIEGPPTDPFSIAADEEEENAQKQSTQPAVDSPFAITPQPFKAQKYSHEAPEIDNPFATSPTSSEETVVDEAKSKKTSPKPAPIIAEENEVKESQTLSQQISSAKKEQGSTLEPKRQDLLTDSSKSRAPFLLLALLLAIIVACLCFFTDTFRKSSPTPPTTPPPLIELPARGLPLAKDDERVTKAQDVAEKFLKAKTQQDLDGIILPGNEELLVNFWEPMNAPTIERLFQGRILDNDRVEVDFLVKDYGRDERLLSLIRQGEDPFLVDWKSFAECEEVTMLGLAQGTLILDNGEEIAEGAIRSWVQDEQNLAQKIDLGNFQSFKLHNFNEEVVALAVIRTESSDYKILAEALAHTEIKHKGKPAIRAVLKVKRIEKEDPENKKPARLEIIKVLSTSWDETSPKVEQSPILKPSDPPQKSPPAKSVRKQSPQVRKLFPSKPQTKSQPTESSNTPN